MRLEFVALIPALALIATPTMAREPGKPVTESDVSAGDVAATPVTDLNLRKDAIPALLIAAMQRPYTLRGLTGCQELAAAIGELDATLGDDVDLPQTETNRTTPGLVAQSVVGSFIPFRGVIREISGARERERQLQAAVLAGVARRAFLKGTGEARNCRYPARSVTHEVFAARESEITGKADGAKLSAEVEADRSRGQPVPASFVSRPVVQNTK